MKYLFILPFLFINLYANSQEAFKGIGAFKIGEYTIDQLMTLSKDNKHKLKPITNRSDEAKLKLTKKYFVELLPNQEDRYKSPVYSVLCDSVRAFGLSQAEINNITITNIIFTFKDNVLYSFHCDYSSELGNAISTKYGKGESKIEDVPTSCGNESTIQTVWDNGNIQAATIQRKYYNSYCEAMVRSFFNIYDTNITADVSKKVTEKEKAFDGEKRKSMTNF